MLLCNLPSEIIHKIIKHISLKEWCYCRQASYIFHIYNDKRIKIIDELNKHKSNNYEALMYSISICEIELFNFFINRTKIDKILKESSEVNYVNNVLLMAIKTGSKMMVNHILKLIHNNYHYYDYCIIESCIISVKYGRDDLVDLFIKKGPNKWKLYMNDLSSYDIDRDIKYDAHEQLMADFYYENIKISCKMGNFNIFEKLCVSMELNGIFFDKDIFLDYSIIGGNNKITSICNYKINNI